MRVRNKILGFDVSAQSWGRVFALSLLGTLVCIAVAFVIDSYSFESGVWRLGSDPTNNVVIPIVIGFPFFILLLSRQRALAKAHHELMIVASTDSLTSCLTRRAFTTLVDAYLERVASAEAKREGALLVIDVDHFKSINDSFGHDRGDTALKAIAQTIRETVRDIDLVGRMGGEEFSVFLPGVDPERTASIAERIRASINRIDFAPEGKRFPLSVSVGGAVFDSHASFADLYRFADQRLYAAKRNGRNRVDIQRSPISDLPAGALH